MQLSNNTVLITGGATGIGLALARAFIAEGSKVIACARTQANLDSARADTPELITYCCDVADTEQRQQMLQQIQDDGHTINVLVNNAGVLSPQDVTSQQHKANELIQREISINLSAPVALTLELLPQLQQQAKRFQAYVINISSPAGFLAIAQTPGYSLTKAGLHSFSQSLRYQLQQTGDKVKVVEVLPPTVETKMSQYANQETVSPEAFIAKLMVKLAKDPEEAWVGQSRLIRFMVKLPRRLSYKLINSAVPLILNDDK